MHCHARAWERDKFSIVLRELRVLRGELRELSVFIWLKTFFSSTYRSTLCVECNKNRSAVRNAERYAHAPTQSAGVIKRF